MTKIFCDRCGKEILDGKTRVVKIENVRRICGGSYFCEHKYEVCPTCANLIQQYTELDYEKEETQ